jgi:hypothetical protein
MENSKTMLVARLSLYQNFLNWILLLSASDDQRFCHCQLSGISVELLIRQYEFTRAPPSKGRNLYAVLEISILAETFFARRS